MRSILTLLVVLATGLMNSPALAELETAAVELQEIPRQFVLNGTVEAVHQSTLSAQTSGQVQQVLVDVDDYVEQGTLVIQLKDTEQKSRLDQARANLQAAIARLQEAEKEHKRVEDIYAQKLVAKAVMDKAIAELKTATAQRKTADAALKQAEEQLEYTRIRAPFTGIVTKRLIEAGETAQPGRPLISGISLEKLRVNVDVPQRIIASVRKHKQARVQLTDNRWHETGDLTIFPYAETDTNSFKVRVDLASDVADVYPGMWLKVAFTTDMVQRLTIPTHAIVYRSEVTAAYIVSEDGSISMRHIRLGQPYGDSQVVLAGVHKGERVALDPVAAGVALKQMDKQ